MNSKDGVFTKYLRPASLAITLLFVLVIAVLDGNVGEFTVKAVYLTMIGGVLSIMVMFYFSSRGAEKIADTAAKATANRLTSEERESLNEIRASRPRRNSRPEINYGRHGEGRDQNPNI